MSTDPELLAALATGLVATTAGALLTKHFFPLLEEQRARREKRRARIRDLIQKKLDANIEMTVRDIVDIGHGAGASTGAASEALYELYAEAADERRHAQLRKLLDDLNREEPFEGYPPEVRPSMARIAALCDASNQASDRELLHPLKKILEEYVGMKRDHQTMRRQNRYSYVIAIISFFVGVVGLVLAFTGPSKDFIATEIRKALNEEKPNKAPEPTAPSGRGSP